MHLNLNNINQIFRNFSIMLYLILVFAFYLAYVCIYSIKTRGRDLFTLEMLAKYFKFVIFIP